MNLEGYLNSNFAYGVFCGQSAKELSVEVRYKMGQLSQKGILGNLGARAISPIVGLGTLIGLLCLRIGSVVEPFIGILADIAVAIICRSQKPLANLPSRCKQVFKNLVFNVIIVPVDLVKTVIAGVGGILAPKTAYRALPHGSFVEPKEDSDYIDFTDES